MNLRIKPFALFLAAAALAMTGCKDDVMGDMENGTAKGEGHYLHVKAGIALPTSTRSATDDPTFNDGDQTNSDAAKDDDGNPLDDFEYGSAYENEIRTMILVYTDTLNQYITHSVVDGITKAPVAGQKYEYEVLGEIEHEKLQAAYEDGVLSTLSNDQKTPIPVRVWAICNYTERLANNFAGAGPTTKATWMDWTGEVVEGPSAAGQQPTIDNTIWAQRSFLMTNAELANVTFPGSIEDWDEYTDKSTPWELKDPTVTNSNELYAIKVERAAARLDIRDGSQDGDQTYHLYTHENSYGDSLDDQGQQEGKGELNLIDVKLTRMALVNMSKNFYYLRRVSATGTDTNWVYCGQETPADGVTPFVVDTDWSAKNTRAIKAVNTNFNFPLYTADSLYNKDAWYIDNYAEILKNKNLDSWTGSAGNQYHIWRYVTENTIPGAENQITVQSTGIVFKGRIMLGKDAEEDGADHYISEDLIEALSNTTATSAIIYRFENRLFAGPKDIIDGAHQDGTNSALYGAVKKVLSNWKYDATNKSYTIGGSGDPLTPDIAYEILFETTNDPDVAEMTIVGLDDTNFSKYNTPKETAISMFRPEKLDAGDGDAGETYGYYCYYFYWNRHNDNGKSGLMGKMEFATVRNNVYKLSVTGIGKLGHPTTPGDDDDPEEPNDPDEDPTNYIQVNVEVLPWVVRVNNIEF